MTRYNLFRIKDGRLDQWNAWCHRLQTELNADAAATLVHEGILAEAFFTFQIEDQWYSLGMGIPYEETERPPQEDLPLNLEHRRQKAECLERIAKGDAAYALVHPGAVE